MAQTEEIHPQLQKAIRASQKLILEGKFLAVDPSSGAGESMPGYAYFESGELTESGKIVVPKELKKGINYTPHRLKYISERLREKFPQKLDLLVIECIHFRPNEKTNLRSFQQLNQSIGAITSSLNWDKILNILPWEWQKLIAGNQIYSKGDVMDAISIGRSVVITAEKLEENK